MQVILIFEIHFSVKFTRFIIKIYPKNITHISLCKYREPAREIISKKWENFSEEKYFLSVLYNRIFIDIL